MPTFKRMIGEAGFVQTKVEPILGGLVAIHSGCELFRSYSICHPREGGGP
jgi:hypothetical protein